MHAHPVMLGSVPVDFILFAAILAGIAFFHHHTFRVALSGLVVVTLYKIFFTGFSYGSGVEGFAGVLAHEWVIVANLFCLLMGFALLSKHFEDSHVPVELPKILPDDWKGGFMLLVMVFVLSSFLDNIAAALIGGTMARGVFRGKVHIGYLAAIVAASNGGGSWSVVGDTTTTMMWIGGVDPLDVLEAITAATTALVIFGIVAARQQQAYSPIAKDAPKGVRVDYVRVAIVAFILVTAIVANVVANTRYPEVLDRFPVIGIAVWAAILVTAPIRRPDWSLMGPTLKGTLFLLSLVLTASMMPVDKLPDASWPTTLGLGFLSAVFDNIPLTALALHQGGYDWGFLAYAVGFGGSMIWFGSSAGVALSNAFPEAKSVGQWLRHGGSIVVAYVVGFFVLVAVHGWAPHDQHTRGSAPSAVPSPRS
ncbi:MAG TPA: citrate transporter [Usitatibacter sp.]|jgi:Na+/H+ antiporter NhaD/arsenite permease-like protein|nr:citrate transporter [Usitatibacter sp.]